MHCSAPACSEDFDCACGCRYCIEEMQQLALEGACPRRAARHLRQQARVDSLFDDWWASGGVVRRVDP